MYHRPSLKEKLVRVYPFKREVIDKIFRNLLMKFDFYLPKLAILEKVDRSEDLNYYPYHYIVGYPIEDPFTLKFWLKRYFQSRAIVLPKYYIVNSSD